MAPKALKANNNKVVDDDNSKTNKTIINLFKNNKSKNSTYMLNIGATKKPSLLTFHTENIFNYLKRVFIEASIV